MAMILNNPGSISTVRFGNYPTNYAQFDASGTLRFYGDATAWDDYLGSLNRDRQGAAQKPDYSYTELGLLFPQNDATEIAYLVFQMSHSKLLDSLIHLHIHYFQEEATQPTFKVDYRIYNNGAVPPGSWTTISTADNTKGIFAYPGGTILQIAEFPLITPPIPEGVSVNLDVQLYRDDDDVTGDVLGKYVDFHYQRDSLGSDEEYTK